MMADKKERRLFVLSEYEEEEQYLRDMARKGYLLEKVTLPGVYHFRKAEPAGDSDEENEIFSDNVSRIDMIERIYKRKMMTKK